MQGERILRLVSQPEERAFCRDFGHDDVMTAELAVVLGTRWEIEKGFQRAKGVVLDQHDVRFWQGWYRHMTLCLLAHADLEVTRAAAMTEKGAMPSRFR